MKLSIIILNWNQCSRTINCLETLNNWNEIVPSCWVVDNASTDQSNKEIQNRYPSINYLYSDENLGFAGGNNLAIQQILQKGDDYLLLLNSDASVSEEDVLTLLGIMKRHPHIGIIGPVLKEQSTSLSLGGRNIACYLRTRILTNEIELEKTSRKDNLLFVDYVPGTVALIRTKLFHEVGIFDENYFFSGEMADLCERARNKKWLSAVYVGARAFHNNEQLTQTAIHSYYDLRNRFLFIKKHRPKIKPILYLFWVLYGFCKIILSLTKFKTAKATYLALEDGLRNKYGNQNTRILS